MMGSRQGIRDAVLVGAVIAAAGAFHLSGNAQTAQIPQASPTFRAVVNYIEVDASVTDSRGVFVRDLTPVDFEIVEAGNPQTVSVFSLVDLPLERADRPLYRATAVEPDVATNVGVETARIYLIVLDGYHIDAARSSIVRRQAREFIERYMGASDQAAIVHIGNAAAGQEFTSSKRQLLSSVDRFLGQKLQSSALATIEQARLLMNIAGPGTNPAQAVDQDQQVRGYYAQSSLDILRQTTATLAQVSGRRKAMVLFSEGIDYDTFEGPVEMANRRAIVRDGDRVAAAQAALIATATRANVAIYTVDPRGLTSGMEDMISLGGVPEGLAPPVNEMLDGITRGHETLRTMANETGGRAAVNQNDVSGAFERVMRDSSTYYVLGFNSTASRDGRFHPMTVRVKRPGVEVRARRGYYAAFADGRDGPAPKTAAGAIDSVGALLARPTPDAGLPMRLMAPVVGGSRDGRTVQLTLEFAGSDIGFSQTGDFFLGGLTIGYEAVDERGAVRATDRKDVALKFLSATRELVRVRGLRYVAELSLPPGRYHLRLAGRDEATGHAGSVFTSLDVPATDGEGVTLDDLLVTSTRAAGVITTGGAPATGRLLPAPSTTTRVFARDETLAVGVTLHAGTRTRPHTVDVQTSVRRDDGVEVFVRDDALASGDAARTPAGLTSVVTVPLARLEAGDYILSVSATSRLAGAALVKDVRFAVR